MMLELMLEYLKKLSLVGTIIAGGGLLLLYLCGIAIYASLSLFLGIEPFTFHLAGCLEQGDVFVSTLLPVLPELLRFGIVDLVQDRTTITFLVLILPIALICLAGPLAWRFHEKSPKTAMIAGTFSLCFMCLLLVVVYFALASQLTETGLLLDPEVNTILQHQHDLRNGMPPGDLGVQNLDSFTISTIINGAEWRWQKLGRMIIIGALTAGWSIVLLWISIRLVNINGRQHRDLRECLLVSRRITYFTTLVFIAAFVFIVAGRSAIVNVSSSLPKVDVSIPGFKVTEQNYLILAAEYEDRYGFYVPTQHSMVIVPKSSVGQMVVKGSVSPFADRRLFVKAPWLGVAGNWKRSIVNGVSKVEGFQVTRVIPESPAYKGGILANDVLTAIGSTAIDGQQEVCEIVSRIPAGEPISVNLIRNQKMITMRVPFEIRP